MLKRFFKKLWIKLFKQTSYNQANQNNQTNNLTYATKMGASASVCRTNNNVNQRLLIQNIDDLDPLSLEPVKSLEAFFDFEYNGKIYRYDAWAWLEYFMTTTHDISTRRHPIFKTFIKDDVVCRCFKACSKNQTIHSSKKQLQIIMDCVSTKIKYTMQKGQLYEFHIYPVSPLYSVMIDGDFSWFKYDDDDNGNKESQFNFVQRLLNNTEPTIHNQHATWMHMKFNQSIEAILCYYLLNEKNEVITNHRFICC